MARPPSTHLTQRAGLPGLRLAGRERIAEMLAHFANHMPSVPEPKTEDSQTVRASGDNKP